MHAVWRKTSTFHDQKLVATTHYAGKSPSSLTWKIESDSDYIPSSVLFCFEDRTHNMEQLNLSDH